MQILLDENLSEIVGILIGDGCISKYYAKDRKGPRFCILIPGDWKSDREYYFTFINPE